MAPTIAIPSKRASMRPNLAAKSTGKSGSSVSISDKPTLSKGHIIQSTKKEKLKERHSSFVSKIEASNHSGAITKSYKKNLKRKTNRETKQNLITGLESLADALPDSTDDIFLTEDAKHVFALIRGSSSRNDGKIKMKSIKSKPGALKTKEKILRQECERFSKNLEIMQSSAASLLAQKEDASAVGGESAQRKPALTVSSWTALRRFIRKTLEKKEDFVEGEEMASKMELDK